MTITVYGRQSAIKAIKKELAAAVKAAKRVPVLRRKLASAVKAAKKASKKAAKKAPKKGARKSARKSPGGTGGLEALKAYTLNRVKELEAMKRAGQ